MIEAGVPGLILMENAGRGAADALVERFVDRLERVVIVGGAGQNGGDAWVVARRLLTRGHRPRVFLAGARDKITGDARVNLDALDAIGLALEPLDGLGAALDAATLVVDGVFGTGLDRPIEGWRADLVRALGEARAPLVALDLPSGIDADTGAVLGVAPRAALTLTFAGHKRGLWQGDGRAHAGEVRLVDIGVPPPACIDRLLDLADAGRVLAPRPFDAHKGSAGHVLVVAGSPGKTGAALLAGVGAVRGGAGLVTLAAGAEARAALDGKVVELMTAELGALAPLAEGKASLVVGPGLGLDDAARELVLEAALGVEAPVVLDADALTSIGQDGATRLREAAGPRVLTPHPGEAARLLGCTSGEVQADRYASAERLASRTGQVVVLKGAGTIVAEPGGRVAVCPLGTPALGVAGTGDVLAGVLGATLAVASPFEAACAAVVLHARAGELAARADRGLFAREVAAQVPAALTEARQMTA
ncbi:MAG: NAD(P)H-hydrate dehydratase [Sandaracinaceae bacterium]|nr:NAD(P)H-hydrate dehydratase [Sandaracinaceae bacterium]